MDEGDSDEADDKDFNYQQEIAMVPSKVNR